MKLPIAGRAQIITKFWKVISRFPKLLTGILVFQILASVATVLTPWLIGRLIDLISTGTTRDVVTQYLIGIGVLVLAQFVLAFLGEYFSRVFGQTVFAQLREDLVHSVTHMPLSVVESAGTGDLIGRTTHDIDRIQDLVQRGIARIIVITFTAVVTYLAAFMVAPALAVLLMVPLIPMFIVLRWYLRRAVPAYQAQSAQWANLSGVATETVEQYSTIDALNMRLVRNHILDVVITQIWQVERYTAFLRVFLLSAIIFFLQIPALLVVFAGAWAIPAGYATLGAVTTVALYGVQISRPLGELSFWIDIVQSAATSLARIFGVDEVEPDRVPSGSKPDSRAISARGVTYEYREGRPVLHGVDLDLRPGETLAIVGPSGAGKSTLGRMIAGIHPPTSGSVTVGGVPLVELSEDDLHQNVSLVTQEHHVFVGTIADNLRLAKSDATDEEMWQVLESLGAEKWVRDLRDGLDAKVGSGALTLTPAQAQQLALARIVLMNPHTLILDEATSLMDPTAARELELSLGRALQGRTVVAIAHRLYTAHDADRVAVMAGGRIVELGTHDELVALGGEYASLWNAWQHE
ncbi:MAG: ABC transporter ATP-binding protein [Actinomycetaceae bacterium]|nr:ABC transporter ATP-binding protein [Actinomycetaceae bacterium]